MKERQLFMHSMKSKMAEGQVAAGKYFIWIFVFLFVVAFFDVTWPLMT